MKTNCFIFRHSFYGAVKVILLASILGIHIGGCAPSNMVLKPAKLDIRTVKPTPGKAALVVARTTSMGFAVNFYTYLDYKFIGVTRGKSCFVKNDIEPGTEYLIARTESLEAGKIQFEPDTVYYVQQTPRMGWVVARVTLTPVSPEHLLSEIDGGLCEEYEVNAKDVAENLTEHEYQEAVTDYEREVKEGYHKEFTDYKGFKMATVGTEAVKAKDQTSIEAKEAVKKEVKEEPKEGAK